MDNQSLRELSAYIDWTPFFHAWELRGVWDRETQELKTKNQEGRQTSTRSYLRTHKKFLKTSSRTNASQRVESMGFFPANSDGDDINVWMDDSRSEKAAIFHTLRQQIEKSSGKPHFALSDYLAPDGNDFIGGFCRRHPWCR